MLIQTFCVLIPLCMLPNFDKLKYAAMFATSSMVYLTGVIAGELCDGRYPVQTKAHEKPVRVKPDNLLKKELVLVTPAAVMMLCEAALIVRDFSSSVMDSQSIKHRAAPVS